MKRVFLWSLILVLVFALIAPVAADTPIKMLINGQESKVNALLINGTTYVPARYVSETLGAKVDYVDGIVKITTASSPNSASITGLESANLPIRNCGEKLQVGEIAYCIESVIYETKNSKQYVSITFSEEASSAAAVEFGLPPAFAIQSGKTITKLLDYSVTADSDSNKSYKRSFTYRFPYEGQISYVYYYPQGKTMQPIGKWTN